MTPRCARFPPRYCDDGFRVPGHPGWKPLIRHRFAICPWGYSSTVRFGVLVDVLCRTR